MDYIRLSNLIFYAHHGYYKAERQLGQRFEMDIEIACDLFTAARKDELKETIDYREIYEIAKNSFEKNKFKLLETVANRIAEQILSLNQVNEVRIRVRKPHVPIKATLDHVEIEITRKNSEV